MEQETLPAQKRATSGTRPARRMRREGRIPAVVYGTGLETISISIDSGELDATLRTEAGLNALINVVVEDGGEILAVAREIQRDPVRGNITHVDLIKVSLDIEIEAEVALAYVGVPVGVREEEGFIEAIETTVAILALPTAIPSSIEVDISHLGIGDTLKVGDLAAIEGVTYTTDADRPLVTVLLPVVEEEPEVEVLEGEELEEGEEGEPVEGEEEAEAADGGEDTAEEG